jgi:mono/diheme cytochrome c family protein
VRPLLTLALAAIAMLTVSACGFGSEELTVSKDSAEYDGAVLFADRCSGCHSLDAAGAQGTGNRSIRAQGPDLNQRKESYEDTLYAIENGGFSGAIMPQNIVVGAEAEAVAEFVAKYSGQDVEEAPTPGGSEAP